MYSYTYTVHGTLYQHQYQYFSYIFKIIYYNNNDLFYLVILDVLYYICIVYSLYVAYHRGMLHATLYATLYATKPRANLNLVFKHIIIIFSLWFGRGRGERTNQQQQYPVNYHLPRPTAARSQSTGAYILYVPSKHARVTLTHHPTTLPTKLQASRWALPPQPYSNSYSRLFWPLRDRFVLDRTFWGN